LKDFMLRNLSTVALLCALATPVAAQSGPTEAEQRLACTWDAMRLCAGDIPDRSKIRQCMAANRQSLSAGCRTVFDASVQAERARRSLEQ
jgi:hypothetical protein